ncbi:hypothetical protein M9458_045463, partial [Cirrhinus mrigala]
VTSRLNGRVYAAAGQAVGALQAYQADLLKDLDKGQGSCSPCHQAGCHCHGLIHGSHGGYGETS